MRLLRIYETTINDRFIDEAVEALRRGDVIIYPTDTCYAFGCDALNTRAIEHVCRIKGINPEKQELSVVCADISMAADYARIDNPAFSILRASLPGPFTFILPALSRLPKAFRSRRSVGIRVPANPIATRLASELGNPLLSASVPFDPDGESISPQLLAEIYRADVELVIDGGEGSNGLSTVVDLRDSSSPEILRRGIGDFNL